MNFLKALFRRLRYGNAGDYLAEMRANQACERAAQREENWYGRGSLKAGFAEAAEPGTEQVADISPHSLDSATKCLDLGAGLPISTSC
jgi:hypothetical protein